MPSRAMTLVMALALPIAVIGQQRPSAPATGLILGQVIDADSGKGVDGVVVTIGAPPPGGTIVGELVEPGAQPQLASARRVLTTEDGRFLFRDLAKGRYAITAARAGYVAGSPGQGRPSGPSQTIELGEGEKLGGVQVRVWQHAIISGTVVDEIGQPVVGITVRALRRAIAGGQPRVATGPTATTDDRGMYRLDALPPDAYVVGISMRQDTVPMSASIAAEGGNANSATATDASRALDFSGAGLVGSAMGMRVGDLMLRSLGGNLVRPAPTSNGRVMTYQPTYYPGASTPSQATVLALKSGEERTGINLQLRLVPAIRVSGTITASDGPGAHLGVTLVPESGGDFASEGQAEAATTVSDATGAFTFLSVPAGRYVLKVRMFPRTIMTTITTVDGVPMATPTRGGPPPPPPAMPTLWATLPVTVGDTDISDLAVSLKPGIRALGRVEFAGTRPAPSADQIQRMVITLQSAEGRTSSPIAAPGRAAPDLTFRTAGYAGGRYIAAVTTLPAGWTLKAIVSGGRDISIEPIELVDRDVTDVLVTFTDRTTTLTGTVTRNARPDPDAEIVVFPADSMAWKDIGVPARRGRVDRVTKTGTFSITGLPPGDYYVAAIGTDAPGDRRDPKVLERLIPSAVRVTLNEGETRTVEVKR